MQSNVDAKRGRDPINDNKILKAALIEKIEELKEDKIKLANILKNCAFDIYRDVHEELERVTREIESYNQDLEKLKKLESDQSLTTQQTSEKLNEPHMDVNRIENLEKLWKEYQQSNNPQITITPSDAEKEREKIEIRQRVEEIKKLQREKENKKREEEIQREKEIKKREEEIEREKQINHPDPIIKLNAMINLFANNPENVAKKNHTEFCNALNELKKDLIKTLEKNKSDATALIFAKATFEMLNTLQNPSLSIEDRLAVVIKYENQCKNTNGWQTLFKALAVICFAAVGFILGAIVGAAIGIAAGAWTGPGAFVTAALGFITGAVAGTSAMIAVTAGATTTGFGVAIGAGFLMFQPKGLRKRTAEVAELGKCYVDPNEYKLPKRVRVP